MSYPLDSTQTQYNLMLKTNAISAYLEIGLTRPFYVTVPTFVWDPLCVEPSHMYLCPTPHAAHQEGRLKYRPWAHGHWCRLTSSDQVPRKTLWKDRSGLSSP